MSLVVMLRCRRHGRRHGRRPRVSRRFHTAPRALWVRIRSPLPPAAIGATGLQFWGQRRSHFHIRERHREAPSKMRDSQRSRAHRPLNSRTAIEHSRPPQAGARQRVLARGEPHLPLCLRGGARRQRRRHQTRCAAATERRHGAGRRLGEPWPGDERGADGVVRAREIGRRRREEQRAVPARCARRRIPYGARGAVFHSIHPCARLAELTRPARAQRAWRRRRRGARAV